jgi:hypothetical protein
VFGGHDAHRVTGLPRLPDDFFRAFHAFPQKISVDDR